MRKSTVWEYHYCSFYFPLSRAVYDAEKWWIRKDVSVEEWFPSNHVNIESLLQGGGRGGLRGRIVEKDDARDREEVTDSPALRQCRSTRSILEMIVDQEKIPSRGFGELFIDR